MKTSLNKSGMTMALLACVALSAFSQSIDELKAKIIKNNQQMVQAMLEGNSQKSLSFYTADAVSMPSYQKMVQGIDAIKKSNEEMMASGMKVKSFEMNTVMVNSYGNVISEIGTYKMSMTMPGMADPMEDQGKYLTLWEKQADGSLKIKVETWNTDINPMAQQH
jgi:ketosteroid isomerase-like protein